MNILEFTSGPDNTSIRNSIQKGVQSLAFYSPNTTFDDIPDSMEILLSVERTGGNNNIEITRGRMSFRQFILAGTYGTEAINSNTDFTFCTMVELARKGFLPLEGNDKLKVEFYNVPVGMQIFVDGIEAQKPSDDVFEYESKTISADFKEADINTANFDMMILQNSGLLTELNFTHENGVVTKHTLRELRMMSLDIDPLAAVYQNGTVRSQFDDFLQVPLIGVKSINFRKQVGDSLSVCLRTDIELARLGLLQK